MVRPRNDGLHTWPANQSTAGNGGDRRVASAEASQTFPAVHRNRSFPAPSSGYFGHGASIVARSARTPLTNAPELAPLSLPVSISEAVAQALYLKRLGVSQFLNKTRAWCAA